MRSPRLAAPDLAGIVDPPVDLAGSLEGNRRGVIQVRSDRDRLGVIELVPRVFPRHPVAIVTPTRGEARKVCRLLRATRESRWTVARAAGRARTSAFESARSTLDLTVAGVVLFADATQILHEDVPLRLRILRRQRIYGLLGDRPGLGRRERLVIEAYPGRSSAGWGPRDRPVDVRAVFADWPGSNRPDEPLGLSWKRTSIWHNADRNAAIARLAGALAGGDAATLWEFGLFLDADCSPSRRTEAGGRPGRIRRARPRPRAVPAGMARAPRLRSRPGRCKRTRSDRRDPGKPPGSPGRGHHDDVASLMSRGRSRPTP